MREQVWINLGIVLLLCIKQYYFYSLETYIATCMFLIIANIYIVGTAILDRLKG